MKIICALKEFVKSLVPSLEELAEMMDPINTGNLFAPDNEPTIEELERMYLKPVVPDYLKNVSES